MTRARRRVAGAVVCLALGVLAACGGDAPATNDGGFVSPDGSITVVDPADREEAPVLEGLDLEGRPLSSADFAGDVLVVNVWGSWCAPCRKEAPVLKKVADEYADRGVQFLGIVNRSGDAASLAFNRKRGIDYPSFSDSGGQLELGFRDSLPSIAIPTTWIVDAEGKVAVRILTDDLREATLSGLIDDVLASAA